MNPYIKFAMEERKQIIKLMPHLKADIGTVGKMIGKAWRKLSIADKTRYGMRVIAGTKRTRTVRKQNNKTKRTRTLRKL
jgi:hypothetical protein